MGAPNSRICPEVGRTKFTNWRMRVLFPAPLLPQQTEHSAFVNLQIDPEVRWPVLTWVALNQIAGFVRNHVLSPGPDPVLPPRLLPQLSASLGIRLRFRDAWTTVAPSTIQDNHAKFRRG
jgi:hypothetical protein